MKPLFVCCEKRWHNLIKPVWRTQLQCVQWKTADDGQRNCPKHVEFYSKNKFGTLVNLVGLIVRSCIRCFSCKILHAVPSSRSRTWQCLTSDLLVLQWWTLSQYLFNSVCQSNCTECSNSGQARRSTGSLQQLDLDLCCAHSLLSKRRGITWAVDAVQAVLPAVNPSQQDQIKWVAKIRLVSYFCPRVRAASTVC